MSLRLSYVLWLLVSMSVLSVSCQREYSPDDVLPTVYSPSVIIGSNNQVVYALNPQTGEKNWELGLPCPIIASPVVYKNCVYIANSTRDTIYKINSRTGEIIKKITYSAGNVGSRATPIADGNLLYVATMSGVLLAIDTGSFDTKWSYPGGAALESSPTIFNGNIYCASTDGNVFRLNKDDGSLIWNMMVTNAKFVSSPAVADPYLYVGSLSDSTMYCIYLEKPSSGPHIRWTYKANGGIRSSPAAYGGTCIFGANDFLLYCLDTTINPVMGLTVPEVRWVDTFKSEVTSSPMPYNQVIYVGCKDYKLYALKIINGSAKWVFSSNGIITSSPVAYNGMVYVGSFDKHLYALDTARGTLKWKVSINGQIECSPTVDDFTKLTGHNSQVSGYTN